MIRRWLRNNRYWVDFRRSQREGFVRAWDRKRCWERILDTPPIRTRPVSDCEHLELHLLCYRHDHLTALWALKTFYFFSRLAIPLVLHLQGYIPRIVLRRLKAHCPNARIILQEEADTFIRGKCERMGWHKLLEARDCNAFMMKLVDFSLYGNTPYRLILDSDILFFKEPMKMMEAMANPRDVTIFQRDPKDNYNISREAALLRFGIKLAPCVNTGIVMGPVDHIELTRCENFMKDPDIARSTGWIEQTLQALCVSQGHRVEYWPDTYSLTLESDDESMACVARHYAGPTRPQLTKHGIPRLIQQGFLRNL